MYMAYETLSPAFRTAIGELAAVQDICCSPNPESYSERRRQLVPPTAQPLVRVHPDTGRAALYLGGYARRLAGMTQEESRPLLAFLMRHATRYEFMYRHRWTANDLLMWDNRCAMHYGLMDYDQAELRRLQRSSILGVPSGYHVRDDEDVAVAAAAMS